MRLGLRATGEPAGLVGDEEAGVTEEKQLLWRRGPSHDS